MCLVSRRANDRVAVNGGNIDKHKNKDKDKEIDKDKHKEEDKVTGLLSRDGGG